MRANAVQYWWEILVILSIITIWILFLRWVFDKNVWKDEKFKEAVWSFIAAWIIILLFIYFYSSWQEKKYSIKELREMENSQNIK